MRNSGVVGGGRERDALRQQLLRAVGLAHPVNHLADAEHRDQHGDGENRMAIW